MPRPDGFIPESEFLNNYIPQLYLLHDTMARSVMAISKTQKKATIIPSPDFSPIYNSPTRPVSGVTEEEGDTIEVYVRLYPVTDSSPQNGTSNAKTITYPEGSYKCIMKPEQYKSFEGVREVEITGEKFSSVEAPTTVRSFGGVVTFYEVTLVPESSNIK
jgi:hypothetical protein